MPLFWLKEALEQLDLPKLAMCPANGCTATCTLEHDPEKVVLKESEPLCVLDVPLHVLAFATFVIIVLGATIIAKILATKRTVAINRFTLIIHGIAIYKNACFLPSIKKVFYQKLRIC
jgi:hypothetical protein